VTALRVVLADDQEMIRAGLRMILQVEDDIEVVAEAADGEAALAAAAETRPDVVVMDIRMPRLDGVAATRRLLQAPEPRPHVLIVTTFDDDENLYEALRAGAGGFLLKNAPPEQLVDAIRTVGAGEGLLSTAVTRRVLAEFARRSPPPERAAPAQLGELTEREVEVLRLVAQGLTNAEIAERLVIAPATAKTHVGHVLFKLDLRDRVQAVVLAYETGLVRAGEGGGQARP
jgi:DNA-binding NarL/FixJ family response regulator